MLFFIDRINNSNTQIFTKVALVATYYQFIVVINLITAHIPTSTTTTLLNISLLSANTTRYYPLFSPQYPLIQYKSPMSIY